MANEIIGQITSAAQNSRPTERTAVSTANTGNVNNRQNVAAIGNDQVEATVGPVKDVVEQAVSDINDFVQTVNRDLQFRVDDALPLGRSIVTVIDSDTQETIREFPSEEALELAHQLREQAQEETEVRLEGLIISAQA